MKNLYLYSAVIFCALVLISCSSFNLFSSNPGYGPVSIGPAGGTVTSSDGRITLTIPAGALDTTETISVKKISIRKLGPEFENFTEHFNIGAAYALSPEKLEFDAPVQVQSASNQKAEKEDGSLRLKAEFLFVSSNGNIEFLNNQNIVRSEDSDVFVYGELNHFSRLVIAESKKDITGSITEINGEDLSKTPVVDAMSLLAKANLSGIQNSGVSFSSSQESPLSLRGQSAINPYSQRFDLICIDGVTKPLTNTTLINLDPSIIEEIQIIKGPSIASVYGIQFNNKIICTTKSKKEDNRFKITQFSSERTGEYPGEIKFNLNWEINPEVQTNIIRNFQLKYNWGNGRSNDFYVYNQAEEGEEENWTVETPTKNWPYNFTQNGNSFHLDLNYFYQDPGNYQAEVDISQNNTLGGVLNVITKSGGNKFSGSVFSYYSDDSLVETSTEETDGESGTISSSDGNLTFDTGGFGFGGLNLKNKIWSLQTYQFRKQDRSDNRFILYNLKIPTGFNLEDLSLNATFKESKYIKDMTFPLNPTRPLYVGIDASGTSDFTDQSTGIERKGFKKNVYTSRSYDDFFNDFISSVPRENQQIRFFTWSDLNLHANYNYAQTPVNLPGNKLTVQIVGNGTGNVAGRPSYFLNTSDNTDPGLVFGYDNFEDIKSAQDQNRVDYDAYTWDTLNEVDREEFNKLTERSKNFFNTDSFAERYVHQGIHYDLGLVPGLNSFFVGADNCNFDNNLTCRTTVDKDKTITVTFNQLKNDENATEFETNELYVNDKWRLNDKWSFNVGVRYGTDYRPTLDSFVEDQDHLTNSKADQWTPSYGFYFQTDILTRQTGFLSNIGAGIGINRSQFNTRQEYEVGSDYPPIVKGDVNVTELNAYAQARIRHPDMKDYFKSGQDWKVQPTVKAGVSLIFNCGTFSFTVPTVVDPTKEKRNHTGLYPFLGTGINVGPENGLNMGIDVGSTFFGADAKGQIGINISYNF